MRVVVETPRWGFRKYRLVGTEYKTDLISPLPALFNYGFIEGTKAADGMPEDAIVLGPRLPQGSKVDVTKLGSVLFVDDGVADDKAITSKGSVPVSTADKLMIHLFFTTYMLFKSVRYLLKERRFARCRYLGFKLCRD